MNNKSPLKIRSYKKKTIGSLSKKEVKKEDVDVSESKMPYMLLVLASVQKEFNIEFEEILYLIYLNELNTFKATISVLGNDVRIKSKVDDIFIENNFSVQGKDIYRLTKNAIRVVDYFYDRVKNSSQFLGLNRTTEINSISSVKSVLGGLFD